ncbi:MAG: hypothetical protein K6L80_11220 [Agarilytica sp.]
MSYHQLDIVADSYIPLLLLTSVLFVIRDAHSQGFSKALTHILILLSCITAAYSVMFFDLWLTLWPRVGMDYSTHTAVAWVFVVFLFKRTKTEKKINIIQSLVMVSMTAYLGLMCYQKYHTALDLITTSLVVAPLFVVLNTINCWLPWSGNKNSIL